MDIKKVFQKPFRIFRKADPNTTKNKAQGLVEFALVLPLLLLIILGIMEFGRLLFSYAIVTTASREGARYGSAVGRVSGTTRRYEDCPGIENLTVMSGGVSKLGILCRDVFPPRGGSAANVPLPCCELGVCPFLHFAAIPNRFIARITVTWFQTSPPRGVFV